MFEQHHQCLQLPVLCCVVCCSCVNVVEHVDVPLVLQVVYQEAEDVAVAQGCGERQERECISE